MVSLAAHAQALEVIRVGARTLRPGLLNEHEAFILAISLLCSSLLSV